MSEERLRILKMVQDKTITAEEAAQLLKSIDQADDKNAVISPKKEAFKMLRVKVLSADGDKVNIKIPVEFAKIALRNGKGFMKNDQIDKLDLDIDMILELIEEGTIGEIVNVESADGDIVKIVIE